MKYLLVFLMLVNFPARANWEWVTENENGVDFFVDFRTLRKDGNRVKFWRVMNYPKPVSAKGQNISSFRSRYEVDCKEETSRVLTVTAFSQKDARGTDLGTETYSEFDTKWEHIVPNSSMFTVLNRVCKTPVKP
jgi:hypothetical protein